MDDGTDPGGGGASEPSSYAANLDEAARDLRDSQHRAAKGQESLDAALEAAGRASADGPDLPSVRRIYRLSTVASERLAVASRSAARAAILLGPLGQLVALWRAAVKTLDRFTDRKTRIAIAMSIVATLSAVAAYRASDEERKGSMCEHQLAEAQTYELIQRQRYLDATAEHDRLSDRYDAGFQRSDRLRRHAQALREPGKTGQTEPSPGALEVEAQIDLAVARMLEPVRDFTDPRLPSRPTLERGLRARAEQDVREIGIPARCAVNDDSRIAPQPGLASGRNNEEYLEPLQRHVAQLHAKSRSDAFAVVGFVLVLVLFTLSEVAAGPVRRVLEIMAIVGMPLSFAFAVFQNDDGMTRYLSSVVLLLLGAFGMSYITMRWFDRSNLEGSPFTTIEGRSKRRAYLLADRVLIVRLSFSTAVALIALVVKAHRDVVTGSTLVGPIFDLLLLFLTSAGLLAWVTVEARHGYPPRKEPRLRDRVATGALLTFALLVPGMPFAAFAVRRDSLPYLLEFDLGALILALTLAQFVARSLQWIKHQADDDAKPSCTARGGAEIATDASAQVIEKPTAVETPAVDAITDSDHMDAFPELPTDVPEGSAGKHIHLHTVREPHARWVVALIAFTALFSATVTAIYTNETAVASAFAAKATDEQLDLMRSSSRLAIETYRSIEGLVGLGESRLRSVAASELRDRATRENAHDGVALWEHELRRWQPSVDMLSNRATVDPDNEMASLPIARLYDGVNGPDNDPTFPAKLFITATVQTSAERLALWDAYDERTTASEGRADVLLGGATLFAIALYLFGQSLGMGATNRGGTILAVFGTGLLGLGILLGVKAFLIPVPPVEELVTLPEACRSNDETLRLTRAEAAAKCYGHAEAILALANDSDAYKRAHEAYQTATLQRLRPGFALAHYRSVRAASEIATTQSDVRHVSLISRDALAPIVGQELQIITDLERRERFVPTTLRESFGFHQYLHALYTENATLLRNALANLRKAADQAEETDGLAQLRLAIALFAAHEDAASSATYERALKAPAQSDEIRETAISDLEVLRASCRAHHHRFCRASAEIDERVRSIVRAMKPSSGSERRMSKHRLTAWLSPEGVRWKLSPSPPLTTMPTSLLVYRHEPKSGVWYVIPSASGTLDPSEFGERFPEKLTGFRRVLTRPHEAQCLDMNGTYLVELRVGGTVLASALTSASTLPHFGRAVLREQGVALCAPDVWTRTPTIATSLKVGYRAKDGSAGVDVYAIFGPRYARAADRRSFVDRAMDDTLREIQGRGLHGRTLRRVRPWCNSASKGAPMVRVGYATKQLRIVTQSWQAGDGLMHVAVLWSATRDASPTATGCYLLASMTSIDAGAGSTPFEF